MLMLTIMPTFQIFHELNLLSILEHPFHISAPALRHRIPHDPTPSQCSLRVLGNRSMLIYWLEVPEPLRPQDPGHFLHLYAVPNVGTKSDLTNTD